MMRWKSPQADRHHSGSAAHPVSNSGEDHATCPCAVLTMYRYDSIKKETKSKGMIRTAQRMHKQLEDGSLQGSRDFVLPVPCRCLLLPVPAPALHEGRHALDS